MVMLLFGLSALPAQGAEPSTVAMQPSPRPAIQPIHRSDNGGGVLTGHVTGTVIDLTTGAPVAGVAVNVGGEVVTSDANGNYDHWLPVGTYTVTLALPSSQGTAAQGPMSVTVRAEAATVQHLNFRSPQPALPAQAPANQPVAPAVQSAPQPTAQPAAHGVAPKRLPRTGSNDYGAWVWLAFGALLLLAGGFVGFGPVMSGRSAALVLRTQAANLKLLGALLSTPAQSARRPSPRPAERPDDFLAALLETRRERP
jgi:hypothetical protein